MLKSAFIRVAVGLDGRTIAERNAVAVCVSGPATSLKRFGVFGRDRLLSERRLFASRRSEPDVRHRPKTLLRKAPFGRRRRSEPTDRRSASPDGWRQGSARGAKWPSTRRTPCPSRLTYGKRPVPARRLPGACQPRNGPSKPSGNLLKNGAAGED